MTSSTALSKVYTIFYQLYWYHTRQQANSHMCNIKVGDENQSAKKCVINSFRATEMRRDATERNAIKPTQAEVDVVDVSRLSRTMHVAAHYKGNNNSN